MTTQLLKRFSAIAALALIATSANAAIIDYTITGGTHLFWTSTSSNTGGQPTLLGVYENGLGPANCLGANDCGPGYWTNDPLDAVYGGTIRAVDGVITSGVLSWTGTYGAEILVNGGSFFGAQYTDGAIDLMTGVRSGGFTCDAGAAAANIFSAICFVANLETIEYEAGAQTLVDNGDGTIVLALNNSEFTDTGMGTDYREELYLTVRSEIIPIPAAVWLFGSALGLLGWVKRRTV